MLKIAQVHRVEVSRPEGFSGLAAACGRRPNSRPCLDCERIREILSTAISFDVSMVGGELDSIIPSTGGDFPYLHVLRICSVEKSNPKRFQDSFGALYRFHSW